MLWKLSICLAVTVMLISTLTTAQDGDAELARKVARFAPTELTADASKLTPKDRQALDKIIAAAKFLDPLFLRQVWSGNEALEKKLLADKSPVGSARLQYFYINDGPWSRLDDNEPFIADVPREKPKGANYYPEEMTKEEVDAGVQTLPEADRRKA